MSSSESVHCYGEIDEGKGMRTAVPTSFHQEPTASLRDTPSRSRPKKSTINWKPDDMDNICEEAKRRLCIKNLSVLRQLLVRPVSGSHVRSGRPLRTPGLGRMGRPPRLRK
eukprot:gene1739-biopygen11080